MNGSNSAPPDGSIPILENGVIGGMLSWYILLTSYLLPIINQADRRSVELAARV